MNIFESITNIIAEIGAISKDKKSTQGFMYRGIDDVFNALQPLFAKHKVFVVPQILEQTREERQTAKGGQLIYTLCKIKFTFYAEDGSFVEAVTLGEAMDSGDKSTNKAMSIAMKYACFQVFCIPTEQMDDPDSEVHETVIEEYNKKIDKIKIKVIEDLIKETNTDELQFMTWAKINSLKEITCGQFPDILSALERKKNSLKK